MLPLPSTRFLVYITSYPFDKYCTLVVSLQSVSVQSMPDSWFSCVLLVDVGLDPGLPSPFLQSHILTTSVRRATFESSMFVLWSFETTRVDVPSDPHLYQMYKIRESPLMRLPRRPDVLKPSRSRPTPYRRQCRVSLLCRNLLQLKIRVRGPRCVQT